MDSLEMHTYIEKDCRKKVISFTVFFFNFMIEIDLLL